MESSTPTSYSTQRDRIHATVDDCNRFFKRALEFRIPVVQDPKITMKMKTEVYADAMVDAANLAAEAEERVTVLSIIMQIQKSEWDFIAAPHLAKPVSDKYMDKLGRLYPAMTQHKALYEIVQRLTQSVDTGRRTAERLSKMQDACSRAAGLMIG